MKAEAGSDVPGQRGLPREVSVRERLEIGVIGGKETSSAAETGSLSCVRSCAKSSRPQGTAPVHSENPWCLVGVRFVQGARSLQPYLLQ